MEHKGLLLVISGPSGAGKGTICKEITNRRKNIRCSVSMTTRELRPGEAEGVNYYYVSKETFEQKIREEAFLECAEVYGNYYGTPKEKVLEALKNNEDLILEIDMQGAMQVKKSYPEAVFIFIVPPSLAVLKKRITKRGREAEKEIEARMEKVKREMVYLKDYDYVIVNDDINLAVNKLDAIINAEKCRVNENIYCKYLDVFGKG